MRRRQLVLGAIAAIASERSIAQAADRIWRIGFLSGASHTSEGGQVRSILLEALAAGGYLDGRTMTWIERYAESDFHRLDALAAELVGLGVDVILTQTTPATEAASRATATLPIVSVTSGDLVGAGLAKSLARPGKNVTGLSFLGPELAVKQAELLKELVPSARRVALIASRGVQPERTFFQKIKRAAPGLGISVFLVEASSGQAYEPIFRSMAEDRVDAALVAPSVLNNRHWRDTIRLAFAARIPLMFPVSEGAEAGAPISYGINRREFYGRAAIFVDRILKGAIPSQLPIEQPTKFELTLNTKSARTLGLSIPQSILLRADRVIE